MRTVYNSSSNCSGPTFLLENQVISFVYCNTNAFFYIRTMGGNEKIVFFRYSCVRRIFGIISFRYALHLQVLLIRAAGSGDRSAASSLAVLCIFGIISFMYYTLYCWEYFLFQILYYGNSTRCRQKARWRQLCYGNISIFSSTALVSQISYMCRFARICVCGGITSIGFSVDWTSSSLSRVDLSGLSWHRSCPFHLWEAAVVWAL